MELVMLTFMALVVALSLFTICVVARDIVRERKVKRSKEELATVVEAKPNQIETEEEQDAQIRFSADPKLSHEQKYAALSSEQKAWYSDICAYTNNVEDVKFVTTNGYDEFRLLGKRVIRLRIKKGAVICEFIIANANFSRYVSSNKITVKQAPTSFKLMEERDVVAAKQCIDIAVQNIREQKEDAKRQQRERRKLARQAAAAKVAKN